MDFTPPPGWIKTWVASRKRFIYQTPTPRLTVDSRAYLLELQAQGRYTDVDADSFVFTVKRKQRLLNYGEITDVDIAHTTVGVLQDDIPDTSQETGGFHDEETVTQKSSKTVACDVSKLAAASTSGLQQYANPIRCEVGDLETLDSDAPHIAATSSGLQQDSIPIRWEVGDLVTATWPVDGIRKASYIRQLIWKDDIAEVESLEKHVFLVPLDNLRLVKKAMDSQKASKTKDPSTRVKHDLDKVDFAVDQLTLRMDEIVDHKRRLTLASKLLNRIRKKKFDARFDFENLQCNLAFCEDEDEMLNILKENSCVRTYFRNLDKASLLEEMISLSSKERKSPLISFPPSVNSNFYADIVNFASQHAPGMLGLLLDIHVKKEEAVSTEKVVQIAHTFALLASIVSKSNNAMAKVRSVTLKSAGISNEGLDNLSLLGISETGRSYSSTRDFLAGISPQILMKNSKYPYQETMDNLEINIAGTEHHLTLSFIEMEQDSTDHLDKHCMSFLEMVELYNEDFLFLTSVQNKYLLDHLKDVTAITLGRFIGEEIPEMSWLLEKFDKHYEHPNFKSNSKPALLFTKAPWYYQETKNLDIQLICEQIQSDFLHIVGEQLPDKKAFIKDLEEIQNKDTEKDTRSAAEARVHEAVEDYGEYIGHGDLLTMQRFFIAKRLRQNHVTALERFEYLRYFRVALFHMRMNKTIMDYKALMKFDVNVNDVLSLGWFKGFLTMNSISNDGSKIKKSGSYELHDQYEKEIGRQLLLNAFRNFSIKNPDVVRTSNPTEAKMMILKFLDDSDIKYFYDKENADEKYKFDDLLSMCRDLCSRTVHAMVTDKMEEESDAVGLRAMKKTMVVYFLNKKLVQDSKYATGLLFDLVMEEGASEKTRARMDNKVCVNVTGQPGDSMHRDMKNEHEIKIAKESLKGLNVSLKDTLVEKTVLGGNTVAKMNNHDAASMMKQKRSQSSYDYMAENRAIIVEEIQRVDPFIQTRDAFKFIDKSKGSPYADMTIERVDQFLTTQKKNFKTKHPENTMQRK